MPSSLSARVVRRGLYAIASGGILVGAGLLYAGEAPAAPGQCSTSPFGGFCDSLPLTTGGIFQHCEGAFGFTNCFLVQAVPIEVDPRGWIPV